MIDGGPIADSAADGAGDGGAPAPTVALLDVDADLTLPAHFYDYPWPNDLRLTADGHPDLTGVPHNTRSPSVASVLVTASEHPGFLVIPVAYFRFTGALAALDHERVIPAATTAPLLLVDVDPASSDRGALFPVVATTPQVDLYVPSGLLAVAPRPGFLLHPGRTYAFVVTTDVHDASGRPVAPAPAIADLAAGRAPAGVRGAAALPLYAKLFQTLATLGVDASRVANATVFTTGDVVPALSDLAARVAARDHVTLDALAIDPDDGVHPTYCELRGTVSYPQYQRGTPPFDTEGLFDFGPDGLPIIQRTETAPFTITIPRSPMESDGYPLVLYFHGSGGLSTALVDRGTWRPESNPANCPEGPMDTWEGVLGCNTKGEGPAFVLAPYGFAMAGSALPVNPERLPGADEVAYLNFANIGAGRDTFRQGVIEQRMFLDALLATHIPLTTLAPCTGITLPGGMTGAFFDSFHVYAQGQSMGGMYTNLISATDPRIRAAVPTGGGGYWSQFLFYSPLFPNPQGIVGGLLGVSPPLTFLHPGTQLFETSWETVDPVVFAIRVARRPLPGHPQRSIYEPVGLGDSYFGTQTYDAMATSFGHREAGEIVWSTMQEALALEGRDGLVSYPISHDLMSEDGAPYTGAVVQYRGDGVYDPHALYTQLPAVKHQYACFLSTFLRTNTAVIVAPNDVGTPCD